MNDRLHNPGREWLDQLAGHRLGEADLGDGDCDECGRPAVRRWTLGAFALCRECRARRAVAAEKSDAALAAEDEPILARAHAKGSA